jgi:ethanolamine kinase
MPPSRPGTILFGSGEEKSHLQMKQMCLALLPAWQGVRLDDIVKTTISGGISNLIVKVAPPGLAPVVLKVFGDKTELLVDRKSELRTLVMLNARGFGAQVRHWKCMLMQSCISVLKLHAEPCMHMP